MKKLGGLLLLGLAAHAQAEGYRLGVEVVFADLDVKPKFEPGVVDLGESSSGIGGYGGHSLFDDFFIDLGVGVVRSGSSWIFDWGDEYKFRH
ncbi:hypothetical protein [Halioxenophilus sp. WMMB6]|uniref:hypothetical protein n=1 Tax=Halioxenophilus sp. WMMB6 TaxID=3073815 RepID=UPI00295E9C05|nr:hypothetical protein [Halioxenophilus sp. WMMB6]